MIKRIAAVLIAPVLVSISPAAQASANTNWICATLEAHPNKQGVMSVVSELISEGYTEDNGGPELFASTVVTQCPEFIPVVQKVADQIA